VNLREVLARDARVPLVIGYGGGVNSLAALLALHDRAVRPDLITFADTRGEKPPTYSHLDRVVRPWLERAGFPLLTVLVKNSKYESLEANCLGRGRRGRPRGSRGVLHDVHRRRPGTGLTES